MGVFLLADSHCHLDWFENPQKIAEKAANARVQYFLSNATDLDSLKKHVSMAGKIAGLKIALGVHPTYVMKMNGAELEEAYLIAEKNISLASSVGEVGIDFKHANEASQRELQEEWFLRYIRLASKNNLPISVHARYAETRALDMLEQEGAKKVHLHWFTNSKKTVSRAISLGYYISAGPIILHDEPSAKVVMGIPLENLLLETDAPVEFGGKKSDPSWIPVVCDKIAGLKGVSSQEVEKATGDNFSKLFI
ncbi:MAG: TatD family hydrolase [archaeon]|nr:TatD family hydrolase [archaeon]